MGWMAVAVGWAARARIPATARSARHYVLTWLTIMECRPGQGCDPQVRGC